MPNATYRVGEGYSESQVMGMTHRGKDKSKQNLQGFPKKCFKNPGSKNPHDKCLSLKNSLQQKGIPVTIKPGNNHNE